ncbi:hypothetical protein OTU49_000393 [Cherax quadricarinatus]|uniref:Uncharacterized protein n=1 Tax=Cherax quadricarinatus TaxID=27406 RepID=A0AAW0XYM3_CHEQU
MWFDKDFALLDSAFPITFASSFQSWCCSSYLNKDSSEPTRFLLNQIKYFYKVLTCGTVIQVISSSVIVKVEVTRTCYFSMLGHVVHEVLRNFPRLQPKGGRG